MPRNTKKSKTVSKKSVKNTKTSSHEGKKPKVKSVKQHVEEEPVKQEPVKQSVEEPVVSDVESLENEEPAKKKRHVPTKESVAQGFDDIVTCVEEEISRIRETQCKAKGVKFLRSLGKKVKNLRSQTVRVMNQKRKTKRKNNENSGFLKPVQLSEEMAKFTGWSHDELRSRVDVTKYICKYIKDNDLQNEKDRRQIKPDSKLRKLLNYDSKVSKNPLTYFSLQTYMKGHFSNPDNK